MHDGTGLQALPRRRVGPPRVKTSRRVLAEAHLADSVARGSGLLWETTIDAELKVVSCSILKPCTELARSVARDVPCGSTPYIAEQRLMCYACRHCASVVLDASVTWSRY
jgi:hypothetical protein